MQEALITIVFGVVHIAAVAIVYAVSEKTRRYNKELFDELLETVKNSVDHSRKISIECLRHIQYLELQKGNYKVVKDLEKAIQSIYNNKDK